MNNNNKLIALGVVVLFAAAGLMAWSANAPKGPSELDGFAQCLSDSGAVFYGAFWCPHCKEQKKMFGSSERLMPYVECSTADGRAQTPICAERGIESYPTWVFADGATSTGTLSLETLAARTGCVLPGAVSPATP